MADERYTDNSPWVRGITPFLRNLLAVQETPEQGASAAAAPPAHRIEDDRTAGTRGVTPQGLPGDETGAYDQAQWHPFDQARLPLEKAITSDRTALARMNAPSKPMTLGQRISGFLAGGIPQAATGTPMYGPASTLRDRQEARKQEERMDLGRRIDENTRSLAQTTAREEGETLRARMAAAAQIAAAQRLGETLRSREGIAAGQQQTRRDVAGITQAGATERTLDKPETRVMGDRTYQYDSANDRWIDVGAAPISQTRPRTEPGNYQPVVNAAGDTVGWVDPKSGNFKPVGSIPGVSEAATGTPGAPIPLKPSGQTASRMQQADAIEKAGDNLITDIQKYRGKLGQWENYWQQLMKGTPIADPDLRYLGNQLMSFAALQPAAHGARGLQAIQAFEKAVGGTPENPDALIRGIQGIQRGLSTLRPKTPQSRNLSDRTGSLQIQRDASGRIIGVQ